jgi:hypothetical protein
MDKDVDDKHGILPKMDRYNSLMHLSLKVYQEIWGKVKKIFNPYTI